MLAVDTNVLVYAHRYTDDFHDRARELVLDLAEGTHPWAIPWPCIYEFYGVVTNPKIWGEDASTVNEAVRQLKYWMDSPSIRLLSESGSFDSVFFELLNRHTVKGPAIHDARIAALCLAHGVELLITADRDFHLYPELPIQNPFI